MMEIHQYSVMDYNIKKMVIAYISGMFLGKLLVPTYREYAIFNEGSIKFFFFF